RLFEPVPGAASDGRDVGRLVVERPAERVTEDEESRARGPAPRPQAGGARPGRPPRGAPRAGRPPPPRPPQGAAAAGARAGAAGRGRPGPAAGGGRWGAGGRPPGAANPAPRLSDQLRMAAAPAVERGQAARESLEKRIRARVVEAGCDVRVHASEELCELL